MTGATVAFYAPLKSPRHAKPSGDRAMARLLLRALEAAGFAPELASEMRTHEPLGDPARQAALRDRTLVEADRLIAAYRTRPAATRPRLWFTYHPYYKAPDWIGPRVAAALGIPYVVAEASRADKRAGGPWAIGHDATEVALAAASVVFALTPADRAALERRRPPRQTILDLPPFLDLEGLAQDHEPRTHKDGPPRLLTVAMMRPGDKLASYRELAKALSISRAPSWTLDIVGDGEARDVVEQLFAPFGSRIALHGRVDDRGRIAALYGAADLYVWPAVNEAYGMALLEAQACGCPVLAGAHGGVASVVRDGETGVLVPPSDPAAFARALEALLADASRRQAMGAAARVFVRRERTLAQAAQRLASALAPLVQDGEQP